MRVSGCDRVSFLLRGDTAWRDPDLVPFRVSFSIPIPSVRIGRGGLLPISPWTSNLLFRGAFRSFDSSFRWRIFFTFRIGEANHFFFLEDVHFFDPWDGADADPLECALQLLVVVSTALVHGFLLSARIRPSAVRQPPSPSDPFSAVSLVLTCARIPFRRCARHRPSSAASRGPSSHTPRLAVRCFRRRHALDRVRRTSHVHVDTRHNASQPIGRQGGGRRRTYGYGRGTGRGTGQGGGSIRGDRRHGRASRRSGCCNTARCREGHGPRPL